MYKISWKSEYNGIEIVQTYKTEKFCNYINQLNKIKIDVNIRNTTIETWLI